MRVKEKKRADDFVQLLQQAQEEIKINIEKQQMQDAGALLEACQETAIALGTMIEQSEGEGTVTVSLLESCCEEVYRLHEAVLGRKTMDALKIHHFTTLSMITK